MAAGVTTIGKLASITVIVSHVSPLINKSNQRLKKQEQLVAVTQGSMTEMIGVVGLMKTETARIREPRY